MTSTVGLLQSPVSSLQSFWRSTIGKKLVMALTGLVFVGFVLVHMLGNLQLFAGPSRFNGYSRLLRHDLVEFTWLVRVTLLAAVTLHVLAAWQLTRRGWSARDRDYERYERQAATYASRTMRWGGVYLLVFIVYHLMHFTLGWVHPAFDPDGAYGNVILGFRTTWVVLFYLGAMAFLALHLYHGVWAMFRTVGIARPTPTPLERRLSLAVAIVVAGGFSLVPLAVWLGFVR